jgi:hypothetical protein
MSSHESLNARLTELTRQLDQKDTELDQEVDDIIQADFDALNKLLKEVGRRAMPRCIDYCCHTLISSFILFKRNLSFIYYYYY